MLPLLYAACSADWLVACRSCRPLARSLAGVALRRRLHVCHEHASMLPADLLSRLPVLCCSRILDDLIVGSCLQTPDDLDT